VLAVFGGGNVSRLLSVLLQIVDGNRSIGKAFILTVIKSLSSFLITRAEHVSVLGMDVCRHDSAMSPAQKLGIGRILQGKHADEALLHALLLVKVV